MYIAETCEHGVQDRKSVVDVNSSTARAQLRMVALEASQRDQPDVC